MVLNHSYKLGKKIVTLINSGKLGFEGKYWGLETKLKELSFFIILH